MSRNSSGTYSLPAGNPVVTGTVIDSSDFNDTMTDLASALTDSLSRGGSGDMLVALKGFAGTVSLPGFAWAADPDTGFYNISANLMGVAVGGALISQFGAQGIQTGNGTVSLPSQSFINEPDCGAYYIGANNIGYAIGGVKILDIKGAAAGGLFINNTLTGAGSERATTTSDLTALNLPVFTAKSADETVNNSVTLQDDADFTGLPLAAGGLYRIRAHLQGVDDNGGYRFAFVFTNAPVNGSVTWQMIDALSAVAGDSSSTLTSTISFAQVSTQQESLILDMFVRANASTGGTFKLQWAQNVAYAGDTTLKKDSFMSVTKIA